MYITTCSFLYFHDYGTCSLQLAPPPPMFFFLSLTLIYILQHSKIPFRKTFINNDYMISIYLHKCNREIIKLYFECYYEIANLPLFSLFLPTLCIQVSCRLKVTLRERKQGILGSASRCSEIIGCPEKKVITVIENKPMKFIYHFHNME